MLARSFTIGEFFSGFLSGGEIRLDKRCCVSFAKRNVRNVPAIWIEVVKIRRKDANDMFKTD